MKGALLGVGMGLLVSAGGCNLFSGPDQSLRLGVEKLEAPARNSAATPISVVVTVMTGGCKVFDRFVTSKSATGATLTAIGRDLAAGKDMACTDDLILTPHTVRFDPPFASTFTITVYRPIQEPLTATVQIE
jgi:hypothetical protein